MMLLPAAVDLARDAVARDALSATPGAPEVAPTSPIARTHRARVRLSDLLQWAANRVAPAEYGAVR